MENYIVKSLRYYCNVSVPSCMAIKEKEIPYYDLTFVLSGSMEYVADGKIYQLSKNDCLFLKPGTIRGRKKGQSPVSYVSFNFSVFEDSVPELEPFMENCVSQDMRSLVSVFSQNYISPHFHSREKCISMLNYIIFELLDTYAFESQNPHVRRMIKYVDEHLNEPLSLAEISRAVNLSPEYACTLFRSETGETLTQYINKQKLIVAKRLIQENSMSLSQIAASLGYENYNYFSRLFKKYFKSSPKDFRII